MSYKKFLAVILVATALFFTGIKAIREYKAVGFVFTNCFYTCEKAIREYKAVGFALEKTTPPVSLSPKVSRTGNVCKVKTSLTGNPTVSVDVSKVQELLAKESGESWLTITDNKGQKVGVSVNQLRAHCS